jgi:antitoxin (DNA-binding transcriptional repressor) of toxin-antitoxin stability system
MKTVSLNLLRADFPKVRRLIKQDGEVILTEHGLPAFVISEHPSRQLRKVVSSRKPAGFDYYARLIKRMPKPISAEASRAIDEMNRKERF